MPGLALVVTLLTGGCAVGDASADDISKLASTTDLVRESTPTADNTADASEPAETTATLEPREQPTEPAAAEPAATEPAAAEPANASRQYTLRIPAVGMSVPVIPVRSNADRVLLPPADPGVGGWWRQGAAPGDPQGSAVIVGHSVRSGDGAFNAIGGLRNGDTINIDGPSGPLTYRVQSIDVLSKDELAAGAEQIFDQSVSGRLVLITCEDWDGQTWRSNIVAIAAPA